MAQTKRISGKARRSDGWRAKITGFGRGSRLVQFLRASCWAIALSGFAAAWAYGVPCLEDTVRAENMLRDRIAIDWVHQPAWVKPDLLSMLDLTIANQLSSDPLDRAALINARQALLNTGWFDYVEQVQRVDVNQVRVTARFVRPFAVVRDQDGDHLVDSSAKLLPRTYPNGGAEFLTVITGARFDRPGRPGLQWGGADVTAGLRLLRALEGKTWMAQIASIDAGNYLRDRTLTIITNRDTRILWGSAPGDEGTGEAPVERKLAYLAYQNETFGHIDGGHGSLIDITRLNGIYAQ